jgi:hypothetical protein
MIIASACQRWGCSTEMPFFCSCFGRLILLVLSLFTHLQFALLRSSPPVVAEFQLSFAACIRTPIRALTTWTRSITYTILLSHFLVLIFSTVLDTFLLAISSIKTITLFFLLNCLLFPILEGVEELSRHSKAFLLTVNSRPRILYHSTSTKWPNQSNESTCLKSRPQRAARKYWINTG